MERTREKRDQCDETLGSIQGVERLFLGKEDAKVGSCIVVSGAGTRMERQWIGIWCHLLLRYHPIQLYQTLNEQSRPHLRV